MSEQQPVEQYSVSTLRRFAFVALFLMCLGATIVTTGIVLAFGVAPGLIVLGSIVLAGGIVLGLMS